MTSSLGAVDPGAFGPVTFGRNTFGDVTVDAEGAPVPAAEVSPVPAAQAFRNVVAQVFRNVVAQGELADQVGIDHFSIGEHGKHQSTAGT
ncbi:hypothetical protein ACTXKZ_00230 [Brachybacterium alimentarium]|uniref:hypothetical protein n=1 Tax=Brachybacterium alimentarium TaxID=47845 RepID=UPI003FD1CEB6